MTYKFGFELETQRTLGLSCGDIERGDEDNLIPPALSSLAPLSQAGFVVKLDGSVDGFEFTTQGGLALATVKRKAQFILDPKWRHVIDMYCSFHIHVSGMERDRVERLDWQWWCIEWILAHLDRVPKRVRKRWQSSARRYFPIPDGDECQGREFVAWRDHTFEFRCWGNVATYADACACLNLTRDAVRYAEARATGTVRSLLGRDAVPNKWVRARGTLFGFDTQRHRAVG